MFRLNTHQQDSETERVEDEVEAFIAPEDEDGIEDEVIPTLML
jgi:hypothetical protein